MKTHKQLSESINDTFLFLGITNVTVFASVSQVIMLSNTFALAVMAFMAFYHFMCTRILINRGEFFVLSPSAHELDKVNFALVLTFFRLTSIPSIVTYLILLQRYSVFPVLIVYCVLAFLSDLLDGKIARYTKQVSVIGAYLDSLSDYLIIFMLSIIYTQFSILPIWYGTAVIIRLSIQLILGLVSTIRRGEVSEHRSSIIAKSSIFFIMIVYTVALLQFIPSIASTVQRILGICTWITLPLLVISAIEKIVMFVQSEGVSASNT